MEGLGRGEPDLVAECIAAMRAAVAIPVTVKCRIGVDDQDPEQALFGFVDRVAKAGCATFVVHARKAMLKGLSPKDNRDVPPLNYELVYRLKRARPDLMIIINGGIAGVAEGKAHLAHVDGVMLGRAAYQDPWRLLVVDPEIFGEPAPHATMKDVFEAMMPYIEGELAQGTRLHSITRHLHGLMAGCAGARAWRRFLSDVATRPDAAPESLFSALSSLEKGVAA